MQLSVLMATSPRFLRYFHAEVVRDGKAYGLHTPKMTRYIWKETVEEFWRMIWEQRVQVRTFEEITYIRRQKIL